jgi:uncharacterized protein YcaQ
VAKSAITVSLAQARRIALRAQLLDGSAEDVLDVVRRLGFLQLDPTPRVAPSHLIVLWTRLGPFDLGELERLLWQERQLFDWNAFIWPTEDFPLAKSRTLRYRRDVSVWHDRIREWLQANDAFRRYVMRELRARGPLRSVDLADRSRVPWQSGGWTGNRNVAQMLAFLSLDDARVLVAGRENGRRLWDIAERVLPAALLRTRPASVRVYATRRLQSLGIARPTYLPGLEGVRVQVEGIPGEWIADAAALERMDERLPPRTTLLSPFDRLIHDRDRTETLFGFRYRLEIYVPKAKREYGYFVLPILHGERLVGRLDPEFDRKANTLRIHRIWWEEGVHPVPLERPLRSLARFLGAGEVDLPA